MRIKLSQLREMIKEAIALEVDEAAREDRNDDGKHDFTDVMIARMEKSGMPTAVAIKKGEMAAQKARKKSKK